MKSKTPLVLMEMLVMVLVFALAAALCLGCFVSAHRMSEAYALRDEAAFAAQSAAETVKGCGGDYERAAELLGGQWEQAGLTVNNERFVLLVTPMDSGNDLLGCARVEVYDLSEKLIFDLTVAWQEVSGHG